MNKNITHIVDQRAQTETHTTIDYHTGQLRWNIADGS